MKTTSRNTITRRGFIQGAAAFGLFTIVPRKVLGGPGNTPPSEELTKAIIGVGGMGQGHIPYPGARLLAICDVDNGHLTNVLSRCESYVQGYKDFREVLAREDIDIVHIATPPHWHAAISIAAAKAGKDIWCEKPMTRTIGEGQAVIKAVQENERIFRINTWFRFTDDFYDYGSKVEPIKKVVESGALGWPLKLTISKDTGFNFKFNWVGKTDLEPQPVPKELDYDFWLGPAPYKPYHPHRVHQTFRGYWDYDGGGLGDMGQHYLDPAQYLLGKDDTSPVAIEVDAPQQHPDAVGTWRSIVMRYADGCEIRLIGGDATGEKVPYLEGPNGKLFKNLESDIPGLKESIEGMPAPAAQVTDFAQAVRNRTKFALNESNGHRSCSLINLGKIAVRLGRNLQYDPDKQEFINDDGANRLINQPERVPWSMV
ncbi:MAG: gfo/Idh/MocA family oxidoreductase [Candidatus Hydrogenedens sp.]|nr:gfo/Idh/MocA family oxidoreductase [Candidatus Hydrogenedens sp.]